MCCCFSGLKDEAAFNVALVELGGHLPIKSKSILHSLIVNFCVPFH